ncbi:hypothetical protein D3C71_1353500 [compost metagenome]
MKSNLAVICDITDNSPVGFICSNPLSGDIAYSTQNKTLSSVLEVLLDNKLFLLKNEKINDIDMIVEDEIAQTDSYCLIALNYSLPFPWRILGVKEVVGDVEEIVDQAHETLILKGDDSVEKQIEKDSE